MSKLEEIQKRLSDLLARIERLEAALKKIGSYQGMDSYPESANWAVKR